MTITSKVGSWLGTKGIWVLLIVTIVVLIVVSIITRNEPTQKRTFGQILDGYRDELVAQEMLKGSSGTAVPSQDAGAGGKFESKGEGECRRILREYFNRPSGFNNNRPDFLRNTVTDAQQNLEIDCWEPSLKLGVEYSGRQHYDFVPYFHKNKEAFMNQKYRDEMKRRMCKDNGVTLIEVPYTVKNQDIRSYLLSQLRTHGF